MRSGVRLKLLRRSAVAVGIWPEHWQCATTYCSIVRQQRAVYSLVTLFENKPLISSIDQENYEEEVTINGWISAIRKRKTTTFLHIKDGNTPCQLQVVCDKSMLNSNREFAVGSAVSVSGSLKKSIGSKQTVELIADSVHVLGDTNKDFPFKANTKYSPNFLRRHLSLRPKTSSFAAFLRVRSAACYILHEYFQSKHFVLIHTPILTSNDCEGAGENFLVTTPSSGFSGIGDENEESNTVDFFSTPSYLTVSGQLHLEVAAGSVSRVYCFGPAFRAEKSLTRQHLAEFYMLEAELAFVDSLVSLLTLVENFVQYFAERLLEMCPEDVVSVCHFHNPDNETPMHIERLASAGSFVRMRFEEALCILRKSGACFTIPISEHQNCLMKEHEHYLVQYCGGLPVFVTDFPAIKKPFYMKLSEDLKFVECFDLLGSNVGELCGGSLREDSYHKLQRRIQDLQLHGLEWYVDLRRYGYPQLGGFGIGFERLLQCTLGINNIKDCLPFPRWYKNCVL